MPRKMSSVLILCPTHDHSDALLASIASVRAQTFQDWEMVVLCDGSPQRTFEIVEAIKARDERIRSISFPKSERFGENFRDAEIRKSSARYICHLSDDDIWLPNHLDCMLELLSHGDWVNQAPLRVDEHGNMEWWFVNHGTPAMQKACAARKPLSVGINYAAYSKAAYLTLKEGWTCAPWSAGTSDVFMWSKFFRQGGFTIASNARTTAIKLPSTMGSRINSSPLERVAELGPWLARASEPGLERFMQRNSSVFIRLFRLFALHGADESLEESLRKAGIRPADESEPTSIGVDGADMQIPLSATQMDEAALAHRFIHAIQSLAPALDPTLVEPLFNTFLGLLMLLIIIALDGMGMWMILNTVKIDV
jgi:hypothetical protein